LRDAARRLWRVCAEGARKGCNVSRKGQKSDQQANERATAASGQKPPTSYEAAAANRRADLDAVRERAERLKALRLEHEARTQQLLRSAGKALSRTASQGRRAASKRAKEPEKKITLADWLAQQRALGRET
jgi:hypothetical protein